MSGPLLRVRCLGAVAALLMVTPPSPVRAQWNPQTNCDKLDGYALEDCLGKEVAEADKALNAAYRKVLAAIDKDATPSDPKAAGGTISSPPNVPGSSSAMPTASSTSSARNGISAAAPMLPGRNACWP